MKTIYELKLSLILNNSKLINNNINMKQNVLNNKINHNLIQIDKFNSKLIYGIMELENHYYQSRWRHNPLSD